MKVEVTDVKALFISVPISVSKSGVSVESPKRLALYVRLIPQESSRTGGRRVGDDRGELN